MSHQGKRKRSARPDSSRSVSLPELAIADAQEGLRGQNRSLEGVESCMPLERHAAGSCPSTLQREAPDGNAAVPGSPPPAKSSRASNRIISGMSTLAMCEVRVLFECQTTLYNRDQLCYASCITGLGLSSNTAAANCICSKSRLSPVLTATLVVVKFTCGPYCWQHV